VGGFGSTGTTAGELGRVAALDQPLELIRPRSLGLLLARRPVNEDREKNE
jgi:hypothetical protein